LLNTPTALDDAKNARSALLRRPAHIGFPQSDYNPTKLPQFGIHASIPFDIASNFVDPKLRAR
jgi:hypothetical protein